MATKTISITESAYNALVRNKKENESFSIVIEREIGEKTDKQKLLQLAGILKGKKGEKFEGNVRKIRKLREELAKERAKKLKEMFR